MLDVFDSTVGDLKVSKLALQEVFFRGVEASEGKFTELCAKEGDSLLSLAGGAGLPLEMDEDLKILAMDKELLMGALAGSHETRVARILNREGELKLREEKRCSGAIQSARSKESERNRSRMIELSALGKACKESLARAFRGEEGVFMNRGGGTREPPRA